MEFKGSTHVVTPHNKNGVVERKNRHIAKIARAMLNERNLPNYFWVEAVATTVYITNRTPTTIVHGMTPKEKFTSKKLDVSHFRVFGCIAYVHVPDEKRSKLDLKVEKCILIGYSLEQKEYRCFNPSTRKLQVSRDVVFDEMVSWYPPLKIAEDGEATNGDVPSNVEQESQLISGPQKFSIIGSNSIPWKGRLKSSNIVDGSSQTSSRNPHVDDESSDLEKNVSEESRILLVITPGARMAKKVLKIPNNNNGV
jgi:hypothetical protein